MPPYTNLFFRLLLVHKLVAGLDLGLQQTARKVHNVNVEEVAYLLAD